MKIGLVCPYHIDRSGGVLEVILALQKEFIKRGHKTKIITPLPRDYEGEMPDSVITLGTSQTTTAFAGTAWQWSFTVDTNAVDEVFEREKFDVLHFHEPWIPVWSRQLVLRSISANVATMHARFWDTMKAKTVTTTFIPYTRPMIKHFDAFTAVSDAPLEYFKSMSKRPVTIIPNAVDIKKYSTTPPMAVKHPNTKTILYIGRLENRKGIKYLLQAFDNLSERRSDIQLLIAGTGPDEHKLRQFVADNDISRVTFLGYITDEDKVRYLHRADLFCSPAHYGESFGIVLLEAMAAGCPIVAGDNVGYQSLMRDTGAMSLVNPKDTVDFSRRLELMLFNEDLRRVWRNWAKKYIHQFEYPKIADQYLDVYKKALEHYDRRKNT